MSDRIKNNVLIPLTSSETSRRVLPPLEKFISPQENNLILFYVAKPPRGLGVAAPDPASDYALDPSGQPLGPKAHPIYADQREESIKAQVEAELKPVTNHLKHMGYEVSLVIGFGDKLVDEILHSITERKIDLVAMSTRARVGVIRFFFSDLADKIVKNADVPVLLVNPS